MGNAVMLFCSADACTDYDSACSGYAIDGYCDGPTAGYSTEYLMRMCKKSCGFCKR